MTSDPQTWVAGHGRPATHDVVVIGGGAAGLSAVAPQVPTPVWGRDELGAGEMWNSNSTVSWLLARSGLDVESIPLPHHGRAPGWNAGITVARRRQAAGGAAITPASNQPS